MIQRQYTAEQLEEIAKRNKAAWRRPLGTDHPPHRTPEMPKKPQKRAKAVSGDGSLPEAPKSLKSRPSKPRAHKYGAQATEIDGIRFASKKEGRVYQELKLRESAGEIADLKLQPVLRCDIPGMGGTIHHICNYKADFLYFDRKLEKMVWLDAKGFRTPIYRLKRKLVLALFGIAITEC